MNRRTVLILPAALLLAACVSAPSSPTLGPDGLPQPQVYRIGANDAATIQFRMLDSLNVLRQSVGAPQLQYDARLNAASATHARDMSIQNRPWHFGSDGSSPLDRAQRVGYPGRLVGEAISETYETEMQTLGAWMQQPNVRALLMDPTAQDMGFAWFQESNGKIWWSLTLGAPTRGIVPGT